MFEHLLHSPRTCWAWMQALPRGQDVILRKQLLFAFGGRIDQLPDSMRPEHRVELRAIYLAVDEMSRESGNIIRLQGRFTPEDYRPAVVMEVIRCLSDEFRQR